MTLLLSNQQTQRSKQTALKYLTWFSIINFSAQRAMHILLKSVHVCSHHQICSGRLAVSVETVALELSFALLVFEKTWLHCDHRHRPTTLFLSGRFYVIIVTRWSRKGLIRKNFDFKHHLVLFVSSLTTPTIFPNESHLILTLKSLREEFRLKIGGSLNWFYI